jgi:hypothetical protein
MTEQPATFPAGWTGPQVGDNSGAADAVPAEFMGPMSRDGEMSSPAGERGASTAPVYSGDTPVVLVVDDEVSVRESLELLIQSAGWQPETFASAEEFLERSAVDGPSCLVLDLR